MSVGISREAPPRRLLFHVSDGTSLQILNWILPELEVSFKKVGVWCWSFDSSLAAKVKASISHAGPSVEAVLPSKQENESPQGFRRLLIERNAAREALKWRPDAILQCHNSVDDISSFLNLEAFKEGIPVHLLPSIKQDPTVTAARLAARHGRWVSVPRALCRLLTKWRWVAAAPAPTLRLPPHKIAALTLLKLAPSNPWAPESAPFASIMAESYAHRDHLITKGVAKEKIVTTGLPVFDVIARHAAKVKRTDSTPRIAIALPPFPPSELVPKGEAADRIRTFLQLVEQFSQTMEIRLCPHPRLDLDGLHPAWARGMTTARQQIEYEIACCDALLASNSNMLSWAAAFGVDAVNYDLWELGGAKYRGVQEIETIETQEALVSWFTKFRSRPESSVASSVKRKRKAGSTFPFDGQCTGRILATIRRDSADR